MTTISFSLRSFPRIFDPRRLYRRFERVGAQPHSHHPQTFSVCSYNVLAECNVHRHFYPRVPEWVLAWDNRMAKMARELGHYAPDVVALQEVDHFHDFERALPEHQGLFSQRGEGTDLPRGHWPHDGLAVFLKRSLFAVEQVSSVALPDPEGLLTKPHNALLVAARHIPSGGMVLVANAHLPYNPKRGDIKCAMLVHLLRQVQEFSAALGARHQHPPALLVCGDMNATPTSPLGQLLGGRTVHGASSLNRHTFDGLQEAAGMAISAAPDDQYGIFQALAAAEGGGDAISNPIDRQMVSVYGDLSGTPSVSICNDTWASLVDHILFSQDSLRLTSRLSLPSQDEVHSVGGLPNSRHGSDHVPLIANFVLFPTGQRMLNNNRKKRK